MFEFRDAFVKRERRRRCIVHTNERGARRGHQPVRSRVSNKYTTGDEDAGAARGARAHGGYDAAFGGARRDEEKSRAKERIYSFRDAHGQWDPKNQRPELWNLYNGKVKKGESIRVFPLSNWTELDVWQYIWLEDIPIVPLYFAATRPVVERDGTLIMVDDDRMRLRPGERPRERGRPLPHARLLPARRARSESTATTLPEIIREMLLAKRSASGRAG